MKFQTLSWDITSLSILTILLKVNYNHHQIFYERLTKVSRKRLLTKIVTKTIMRIIILKFNLTHVMLNIND